MTGITLIGFNHACVKRLSFSYSDCRTRFNQHNGAGLFPQQKRREKNERLKRIARRWFILVDLKFAISQAEYTSTPPPDFTYLPLSVETTVISFLAAMDDAKKSYYLTNEFRTPCHCFPDEFTIRTKVETNCLPALRNMCDLTRKPIT